MQPKWVHTAEHTRIVEFPALERDKNGFDSWSRIPEAGWFSCSVTSEGVSLLMKISSPFQDV